MSHPVTFGVRIPNSGPLASPQSMLRVAREAEDLGFDSVWVHDHITWTDEIHRTHISSGNDEGHAGNPTPDFYEALTSLSFIAGHVQRVRLGIACVVVPNRNPVVTAKQLATLDVLTGGRLDVGVGLGSPSTVKSREFEVMGVNKKERGRIADDYLRAMKTLWADHPATYHGEYVSFDDAAICPKPLQRPNPPLWVGGWTEHAMRRTAALGDGWLPAWLLPEDIGRKFGEVKAMAAANGRDPERLSLGFEPYACIDEDGAAARAQGWGTLAIGQSTFERSMSVEQLTAVSLIGSPAEIRKQVRAYSDAGVSHFEMKFIYPTLDRHSEMLRLFAREVLSAFR